ncbi:MAG: hypothetical protein ABW179_05395, partial [Methylobacterium sp.]
MKRSHAHPNQRRPVARPRRRSRAHAGNRPSAGGADRNRDDDAGRPMTTQGLQAAPGGAPNDAASVLE